MADYIKRVMTSDGEKRIDYESLANLPKVFKDVAVPIASWTASDAYDGYPFGAAIALNGVDGDHVPSVSFAPQDIAAYGLCGVAESGAGTVTVYASTAPGVEITIPSIVCLKGQMA